MDTFAFPEKNQSLNQHELYDTLCKQLEALIEDEHHLLPNLANASALLAAALRDINWVGFYLMTDGELLLGPFQGKVACTRIAVGRGVCGTAVQENHSQLVPDVHAFPGHIACDAASRSEVVIPIRHDEQVVGVLDIDSPLVGRFDQADMSGLERFVHILESNCNWQQN